MKKITKPILSWALYDWANSAYATTVMAGFFPVFLREYWGTGKSSEEITFSLSQANSISAVIIILAAPLLGSITDYRKSRKGYLFFFMFMGALSTFALSLLQQGELFMAVTLFILGNIGFAGSNVFYDALLPEVASEENNDFVSAFGFAVGYLGGGVLFLLNVLMTLFPERFGLPDATTAIKVSFVSVAIWWIIFSLPLFLNVKEKKRETKPMLEAIALGYRALISTFKEAKNYKKLFLFLIAYWFYMDGVDTIIRAAVDYGGALGFEPSSLIAALLIVQFIGFPAAIFYGYLANKFGAFKMLVIAIIAYIVITFLGVGMSNIVHFYELACLVALFQGGVQALSRSYFATMVPANKVGEFFGLFNMVGKFAVVLGPILMGFVTVATGNHRLGILALQPLFIIGLILLFAHRKAK